MPKIPLRANVKRKGDREVDHSEPDFRVLFETVPGLYLIQQFFRASNAVNIQGTGLGLNIIKRYVDLLNGTISFFSELGKGTKFTITIQKGLIDY